MDPDLTELRRRKSGSFFIGNGAYSGISIDTLLRYTAGDSYSLTIPRDSKIISLCARGYVAFPAGGFSDNAYFMVALGTLSVLRIDAVQKLLFWGKQGLNLLNANPNQTVNMKRLDYKINPLHVSQQTTISGYSYAVATTISVVVTVDWIEFL